jgi:hypothetical protein
MGAIDRHALRFVDGRGIAMIDMGIILEVERDRGRVEPHRHAVARHRSIVPSVPFFTPSAALVLQEHDAVAARTRVPARRDATSSQLAGARSRSRAAWLRRAPRHWWVR